MKMKHRISTILMSSLLLMGGVMTTGCGNDDLENIERSVNGVTLRSFGPCPLTRGKSMEIIGAGLGSVNKVLFPKGNQKVTATREYEEAKFTLDNDGHMTVTVPDNVVPGKLRLVVGTDTIVSNSLISYEEEVAIKSIDAATEMRAGDIITIKGDYVWNIVSLTFPSEVTVWAQDFVKNTRTEIQVAVPAAAQSGAVTYYDGNSNEVQMSLIENQTLRQAVIDHLSESPALGGELTVYGTDLDLIGCANFPFVDSVKVEVNEAATELKCIVPKKTAPGDINFALRCGKNIPVPFTPLMVTPTAIAPDKDLKEGDVVTITGEGLDAVEYILLPGDIALAADEITISATSIQFTVPKDMGDGVVTLVQHENYSVETEKIAMKHEGAEEVIWSGSWENASWGGNQDLAWGGYDWSTVKEGQELTLYVEFTDPTAGWACISLRHGDSWGALPGTPSQIDLVPSAEQQRVSIKLTQEIIDDLNTNGGLVITGAGFILKRVSLSILETIIWSGTFNGDNWAGLEVYKQSDYDWNTFTIGQKVVVTFASTTVDLGWGCIIAKSAASGWPALSPKQFDFSGSADDQIFEFTPTQDDVTAIITSGLVLQGSGVIYKKISIQ